MSMWKSEKTVRFLRIQNQIIHLEHLYCLHLVDSSITFVFPGGYSRILDYESKQSAQADYEEISTILGR